MHISGNNQVQVSRQILPEAHDIPRHGSGDPLQNRSGDMAWLVNMIRRTCLRESRENLELFASGLLMMHNFVFLAASCENLHNAKGHEDWFGSEIVAIVMTHAISLWVQD